MQAVELTSMKRPRSINAALEYDPAALIMKY